MLLTYLLLILLLSPKQKEFMLILGLLLQTFRIFHFLRITVKWWWVLLIGEVLSIVCHCSWTCESQTYTKHYHLEEERTLLITLIHSDARINSSYQSKNHSWITNTLGPNSHHGSLNLFDSITAFLILIYLFLMILSL